MLGSEFRATPEVGYPGQVQRGGMTPVLLPHLAPGEGRALGRCGQPRLVSVVEQLGGQQLRGGDNLAGDDLGRVGKQFRDVLPDPVGSTLDGGFRSRLILKDAS